jgi:hypothetical protein
MIYFCDMKRFAFYTKLQSEQVVNIERMPILQSVLPKERDKIIFAIQNPLPTAINVDKDKFDIISKEICKKAGHTDIFATIPIYFNHTVVRPVFIIKVEPCTT